MFDHNDTEQFEAISDFLIGDREHSPFCTWTHYAQLVYLAFCAAVYLCGGQCTGG